MSVPIGTIALNRARAAWGDAIPAWVEALAAACDGSSQKVVARRLGYSDAAISNALRNTYKGGLTGIETAVRGAFLSESVPCPVVGDLPRDRCMEYQRRPYANTNQMRVALYRACRSCPHNVSNKGAALC